MTTLQKDHNIIVVDVLEKDLAEVIRKKITRRNWGSYHPDGLQELYQKFKPNIWNDDPDVAIVEFNATIHQAIEKLCPLRVIRLNRPSDITDQKLEKMKKKRKQLRKEFNKAKREKRDTVQLSGDIEQLNWLIKKRITIAKRLQLSTKMNGNNPKSFWKAVADLEGKTKETILCLPSMVMTLRIRTYCWKNLLSFSLVKWTNFLTQKEKRTTT